LLVRVRHVEMALFLESRTVERARERMSTHTHTHTMRPRIDAVAGATGQRLHYCGQRPRKRGSAGSLRARPLTAGKKAHAVAFSGDGKRPRVTDLIKL